jgi:hypothetical protein
LFSRRREGKEGGREKLIAGAPSLAVEEHARLHRDEMVKCIECHPKNHKYLILLTFW